MSRPAVFLAFPFHDTLSLSEGWPSPWRWGSKSFTQAVSFYQPTFQLRVVSCVIKELWGGVHFRKSDKGKVSSNKSSPGAQSLSPCLCSVFTFRLWCSELRHLFWVHRSTGAGGSGDLMTLLSSAVSTASKTQHDSHSFSRRELLLIFLQRGHD